jgi:hypothetical protein
MNEIYILERLNVHCLNVLNNGVAVQAFLTKSDRTAGTTPFRFCPFWVFLLVLFKGGGFSG